MVTAILPWFSFNEWVSLQYSIAPWQYDEEVVRISKKMTKLHEDHADLLIELARESTRSGALSSGPSGE